MVEILLNLGKKTSEGQGSIVVMFEVVEAKNRCLSISTDAVRWCVPAM